MNKKLQMILLALGLAVAVFIVGCSKDSTSPTVTAPNAPTGVTATITSPTTVRIDWTASALDEAPNGYAIERRTAAESNWSEIGSVGVSVATYNDNTIARGSGTTYLYRVGAYNDGGSTYSSSATVTVKTFTELLDGTWDALDALNQTGADSSSIIFDYNQTQGGFIYRRTDWYQPLDSEDIEEGIYSATATTITWTALRINGASADTSYTWNYDMVASGLTMSVEYDWGEGAFDVDFIYVTP
jgi:hypothetical protein